jgi:hypothetical protein
MAKSCRLPASQGTFPTTMPVFFFFFFFFTLINAHMCDQKKEATIVSSINFAIRANM